MNAARDQSERMTWTLLVLAGLLPALSALPASFLADDAAILGYVQRKGALADWTGPQYGLQLVSFWRPVVTSSWWLQAASTGTSPAALHLFNVLNHLGCVLLVAGIVRRLGGGRRPMLVAGLLVAFFPDQGGTVTWIAGRVDTLSGLFVLLTAWVALGRRPGWAALPAFLACASKEVAFAVPAWVIALRWAAGDDARALLRNAGLTVLAVVLAFVWRRLALGIWTGGYPVAPAELLGHLPGILGALALGCWPILVGVACALVLGRVGGGLHGRLALAGLACAAVSFLPIAPMLTTGVLEEQNARWLFVGDAGLALTCAAGVLHASRSPAARLLLGVLVLLLGWRAVQATLDNLEWADATHQVDAIVLHARQSLEGAAPDERPVLFDTFPGSWRGAYCLGFGAADRFRAPFPETPRPAWPLRPMFGRETSRRAPAARVRADGSLWPWSDAPATGRIEVRHEGERLAVDERAFLAPVDESPMIEVRGSFPDARFELVVYTELGYEPAPWNADASADRRSLSLMRALACSNGTATLGQALAQAADVGATRAYLEVRAVSAAGELLAASPWIELVWSPDLISALR